MVLIRRLRLTAAITGGLWNKAPLNVSRACATFCAFSTGLWKRTIPTYSLPALCCDLTNLVALSIQTIKQPDTFGSRVPEWPVFCTRNKRLIHATTSWDDGLTGLSKLIQPVLTYSSMERLSGDEPFGNGV